MPLVLRANLVATVTHRTALNGRRNAMMMAPEQRQQESKPRAPAICGVVDARQRGGIGPFVIGNVVCGMERLHLLESRLGAVAV